MIQVEDIHKSFGSVEVLKGLSFNIEKGEVVSIVGPSGAGKTTLLQIMGTLLKPNQGTVTIEGVNPFLLNEKELATFRNTKIGFVFQFHHLLPEFTALENVLIPALIKRTTMKEAEEKARSLLAFMGLTNKINQKPNELSGGEQQRVAVARALINNPLLILADEPSGNLDLKNKKELHELFFKLRNEFNQTFIIVTHDVELAEMSDRQIHLADGLIVK